MTEAKISWGLYDVFGNLLPQDPAEGPDKIIPFELDEFRCDICGSVFATNTGLNRHRKTHFEPHDKDWSQFMDRMKKRKLERDEEARAKKRKIETEKESKQSTLATEKSADNESDQTDELSNTPGSSVQSTPVVSPVAQPSSHSPSPAPINNAQDKSKISREDFIKEAKNRFSAKEIAAELVKRKALIECICGILFKDHSMYILHRGLHHTDNPLQCAICNFVAQDHKTFMIHFFKHKKSSLET